MDDNHNVAGVKACLADYTTERAYLEELDGSWNLWGELSPSGKLAYLARDAATYDLSHEQFAEVVRDVFCDLPPAVREDALLRIVLHNAIEMRELELLVPDGRTEPTPLAVRFRQLLNERFDHPSQTPAAHKDRDTER